MKSQIFKSILVIVVANIQKITTTKMFFAKKRT